jgi:excisionase family DNA binding protein
MTFTLAEAAKAIGRDKSTLARAVRTGRISATRDDDGVWRIDESELRRVYPRARSAAIAVPLDGRTRVRHG